ncbi:calnexin [Bacillus rossius redtenbacheri]|uniref:calnexin n=1 Tax=Bacillus rossius redtenbacheri TaxID=93214 RepID=UPI002FDD9527
MAGGKLYASCLSLALLCSLLGAARCQDDDDVVVTTEEVDDHMEDFAYVSPVAPNNAYLAEHFDDVEQFKKKWVLSEAKKEGIDDDIAKYDGKWSVETPQKNSMKGDLGLVLKSKAKHAAISSRLNRPFQFAGRPLVVQYEVTLQEGQECGGAYLKLLSLGKHTADLRQFHDKTPYTIMFGPDKCGNDHKLHFIFRHKNPLNGTFTEKHSKKPKDRMEEPFKDKLPHLYTLIVRPDNTFTILLDHKTVNEGSLLEDFTPAVNPPAEIDDPSDRKPSDWDDREKIPDPDARKPDDWDEDAPATIPDASATKPEGWLDDEPEMIPDPNALKPDDWDVDMDGEWEAPLIVNPRCEQAPGCGEWKPPSVSNPAYKGKWRTPMIDNPNYKGKWKPQRIPNPDFFEDKNPFRMADIGAVGFELWSMSDMILFDNIIVTDDPAGAAQWAAETFDIKRRKFEKEGENLLTRLINYTNERPWLWAVYVVVIGLPVVLLIVMCCTSSSQEKEEQRRAAEAKKTDAVSADYPDEAEEDQQEAADAGPSTSAASKGDLEVKEAQGSGDEAPLLNREAVRPPDDAEERSGDAADGDARHSPRKRTLRKDD